MKRTLNIHVRSNLLQMSKKGAPLPIASPVPEGVILISNSQTASCRIFVMAELIAKMEKMSLYLMDCQILFQTWTLYNIIMSPLINVYINC